MPFIFKKFSQGSYDEIDKLLGDGTNSSGPIGGGSGSGIIDVTELPTEGKVDIVYRMTESVETPPRVYCVIDGLKCTLTEYFGLQGISANIQVYVVSDLPTSMVPMDEATFTVPIYILEDTGIGVISPDGTPEGAIPLGTMMGGDDSFNKGWTDDIDSIDATNEANYGFYSVRGENKSIHTLYMYVDGKWAEYQDLSKVECIIDVEELPTENIIESAIYRKPSSNVLMYFTLGDVIDRVKTTYPYVEYYLVDELPNEMKKSPDPKKLLVTDRIYIYVLSDNGYGFISSDGTPESATQFLPHNLPAFEQRGFTDALDKSLPQGTYTYRVREYYVYKNNAWKSVFDNYYMEDKLLDADYKILKILDRSIHNIEIPKEITAIRDYTFYKFSNLREITIPRSVRFIGSAAFGNCSTLDRVIFEGTPSDAIDGTAFSNCSNLTDIYVPWAEGAVASAPWGATNATIHYNSTV